jgi:hypothetical protein
LELENSAGLVDKLIDVAQTSNAKTADAVRQ